MEQNRLRRPRSTPASSAASSASAAVRSNAATGNAFGGFGGLGDVGGILGNAGGLGGTYLPPQYKGVRNAKKITVASSHGLNTSRHEIEPGRDIFLWFVLDSSNGIIPDGRFGHGGGTVRGQCIRGQNQKQHGTGKRRTSSGEAGANHNFEKIQLNSF